MEMLRDIAAATTLAMLLVAMFKLMFPAATSKVVGVAAIVAGEFAALAMVGIRSEIVFAQGPLFTLIVTGIFAAAAAMGIRATDNKADEKRNE